MGFLGIALGLAVAFLWGAGDILATLAGYRLSTFKTTFISQVTSLFGLLCFSISTAWFWHLSFTPLTFALSASIGIFTGLCAALGYLALYRALVIGPMAMTGPITATSPIFTLILSVVLLHEHLTVLQFALVTVGILGIILVSTNLPGLHVHFTKSRASLWTDGILWALIATLAFGALDFGVGAAVSVSNSWLLPALFTRFFAILFLCLFSYGKLNQRFFRHQTVTIPSSHSTADYSQTDLRRAQPGQREMSWPWKHFPKMSPGVLLALLVGIIESAGALLFSLSTRIATTGVTTALASGYCIFVMLFGMAVYQERLAINQFIGVAMFMVCIFLLAFL